MSKGSKLYKPKQVPLENYTNMELAFLLSDVLKEVEMRKKASPKLHSELNQRTFDIQHEFEFDQAKSRKDMANEYERMLEHLRLRRMAKQEDLVAQKVFYDMGFNPAAIIGKLGQKISNEQRYLKIEDNQKVMQPRTWKDFYENNLSIYK